MLLDLIAAPVIEPITLVQAKLHLRIETTVIADDALIEGLITAAREKCEAYTRRAFVQRTYKLSLPEFTDGMQLPRPPLQSVTNIKYYDDNGVLQTLGTSVYTVHAPTEAGGYVVLAYDQSWPTTRAVDNAVQITFVAGYGGSATSPQSLDDNVPESIKSAIKLIVGDLYENREGQGQMPYMLNPTVKALLNPFRWLTL